jgi:hypothetical protein
MKHLKNVLTLLVIALPLLLVSCGGDDDEPTPSESLTAKVTYNLTPSADLLSVANIQVTYKGTDGATVTEDVTTTNWSKTFSASTLPSATAIHVSLTPKTGVTLSKASYDLSGSIGGEAKVYKGTGVYASKLFSNTAWGATSVKADKVNLALTTYAKSIHNVEVTIDATGNITTADNITLHT